MRIAVIGSGYVGIVAAACFAEIGHHVVCVDNDASRVAALQSGMAPIYERFLPELLAKHRGDRLNFSTALAPAVRFSQAIFIAVGTPARESGAANLSCIENVSKEIAAAINGYKVVIEKSTVPVCTNERMRTMMAHARAWQFDVVSNPEFLREGTAVTDFLYPDRIVVGADTERAAATLSEIYRPLTDGGYARQPNAVPRPDGATAPSPLMLTSAKSAEMIKHASNAFLAMKISFINAVANLCELTGADIRQVSEGIGADRRIGPEFLNPGIGYGGSCLPKDLAAFRAVARELGCEFKLLDEVMRINAGQGERFLSKVRNALWNLKGKRVAALGLSFKADTDDIRESPAIAMVRALAREGCEVAAYDPAAMNAAKAVLPAEVRFASDPYDAARDSDALVILTNWDEFGTLDLDRLRERMKRPIVIDGRNMYSPEAMAAHGFIYYSVGRPGQTQSRVMPKKMAG